MQEVTKIITYSVIEVLKPKIKLTKNGLDTKTHFSTNYYNRFINFNFILSAFILLSSFQILTSIHGLTVINVFFLVIMS